MKKLHYIWISIITMLLSACGTAPQHTNTIYVSILPLKGIIKELVGNDFQIEVLVPSGVSPESFEPSPKQFVQLNQAQMIFSVGLIDFESNLLGKITDQSKVINLSRGVALIAGSCSHCAHGHHQAEGIDPHIWTSPRALQTMASNAYAAIHRAYPKSEIYTENYTRLMSRLGRLDNDIAMQIAARGTKYFIIYHPALTYYARDYGIRQVAIEDEGKEPTAKRLSAIIRQARADGVKRILYQSQFPVSTVEIIARDLNATCTEIDPLCEDVIYNIQKITDLITL